MLRRWWPGDKSTGQGFRCDICRTVSAFWPVTGSNTNLTKIGLQRLIRARSTNLCTNRRSHENLRRRHAVSIYATLPTISATIRSYSLCCIKAGINGSRYIASNAEGTVAAQFQLLFEHITRGENNHESLGFNQRPPEYIAVIITPSDRLTQKGYWRHFVLVPTTNMVATSNINLHATAVPK